MTNEHPFTLVAIIFFIHLHHIYVYNHTSHIYIYDIHVQNHNFVLLYVEETILIFSIEPYSSIA